MALRRLQAAKRSQAANGPYAEPRNGHLSRRVDAIVLVEDNIGGAERPWRHRLRRGRRIRHERRGIPGNPGDLAVSSKAKRSGDRETKAQATSRCARLDVERMTGARWYRQPKETKLGGTDGKESECTVVPMRLGHQTQETPRREGCTGIRNHWAERRTGHRARSSSQRESSGSPNWPGGRHSHLRRFLDQRVRDGVVSVARRRPDHEEPDARIGHVRIRKGSGRETALVYPLTVAIHGRRLDKTSATKGGRQNPPIGHKRP